MKNIIASTGLVALGIAGLQPATETNADPNPNTPWSISASLRGFYDDNITTLPDKYRIFVGYEQMLVGYEEKIIGYETIRSPEDGSFMDDLDKPIYGNDLDKPIYGNDLDKPIYDEASKQSSYGISFSPSVNFSAVREQGEIGLGYTFGLKWYEDRDPDSTDESHTIAAKIAHSVSPTFSFELANNLRIAQEPEIEAGTVRRVGNRTESGFLRPIRGDQDYLHNQASFYATQMLSDTYSIYAGYENTIFNFDDRDFSFYLDRVEHTPLIHLKAQLKPNTVGLIGYRFKVVDYTGDAVTIDGDPRVGRETMTLSPDARDSDSHYVYAGLDHAFTPTLQGSLRLGAQFTKFVNADDNPQSTIDDATSPFADANLSYGYAEGSHFQIGVKHERNRHDMAFDYYRSEDKSGPNLESDLILDQEQTVVYASVHHQLTAKLNASLVGHYLNGTYEGGGPTVDGQNDEYWAFGLSLDYAINPYLAAEAGYNFDDYESGVQSEYRSYDRNRVYVGLRASY